MKDKSEIDNFISDKKLNHLLDRLKTISMDDQQKFVHNGNKKNMESNDLRDLVHSLIDEFSLIKNTLKEQSKINELRVKIWQIAARKYMSEKVIIQALFDLIGPFFKVSYVSFYQYINGDAVCSVQWKSEGIKSTLGLVIPKYVHEQFEVKEFLLLYSSDLASPQCKDLLKYINVSGIKSFVAIPYMIHDKIAGFFNFSDLDSKRKWTKIEIDILKEITQIITIKIMEIHAENALLRLTERLDKKVDSHSQALRKAKENIHKDFTRRKKLEKALEKEKELFEITLRSISDAVVTINNDKHIVFINRVAEVLVGIEQENVIGKDFRDFFQFTGSDKKNYNSELITSLLIQGKTVNLFTHTLLYLGGNKYIPVAGSAAPVRSKENTLIGAVLVFRDISEQIRMEQELFRKRNLDSLSVLTGGLAHDFNNILTGIITNISLAKTSIHEYGDISELLHNAEHAALRASRLTNQLLTFSKGGVPVRENASIKKIIIDSTNFCLSGSNVHYEAFLPDDLWAIEADRGQVFQVLNNLIINAKESMPDGGVITINACNMEVYDTLDNPYEKLLKKGKYIKVMISDQGNGIKEEELDKIFDPYFTTKETGTGLGLTSVYSIIKNHGGYIHVESKPRKGSQFEFYLPATGIISIPEKQVPNGDLTGCGRILIMDDDEDVRKVIVRLLEKMGYHVTATIEGSQAIESYKKGLDKKNPYDLVIMDLTVRGGMQGLEAVQEILLIDPDAKIIVASGYSHSMIMSRYKEYGIKAVINKPFAIDLFLKLIKKMCSG